MATGRSPLIAEFLTWVSTRRRTHADVMEAWRSTCPRHAVWEDALADRLVQIERGVVMHRAEVTLTPRGRAVLDAVGSAERG